MRVLDCDCGKTLQAGNDEDLASQVREHVAESHPDTELTDDQARELVADRAYEASDS
jgi:predicted small metal-binding protein